jgi:hypothetical protein
LRGYYHVTDFKINNRSIAYSPLDSVRWQEVTFEKWTSLTYKVNKKVKLDLSNGGGGPMRDIDRTFEVSGVAGGRRVFHYYADTATRTLYLQDKNTANLPKGRRGGESDEPEDYGDAANKKVPANFWIPADARARIGDENAKIAAIAASTRRDRAFARGWVDEGRKKMVLHYDTRDGAHVVLTGIDENKDSVYIVLDRIDKKYALSESRLSAGKYAE